jgi:peptidoglycan/LPS O-acetylase OafA/YrhL
LSEGDIEVPAAADCTQCQKIDPLTRSNSLRFAKVDALRGFALLLVLGRHLITIPNDLPLLFKTLLFTWREIGWIGVDLFFVLSGFLVSGILFVEQQRTGSVQIIRFLTRRGLKIYPSFYFFIAVSFFVSWGTDIPAPLSSTRFVGEVLFIQNYYDCLWNHTWSLAVEEHFYLSLAALTGTLLWINQETKDPFHSLPALALLVSLFLLVARTLIAYNSPEGCGHLTFSYTHLRIDSLFFGVFLSYLYHFKQRFLAPIVSRAAPFLRAASILVFLLPVLFPISYSRFCYSIGFTLLYLGFGATLLLSLPFEHAKPSASRWYRAPLERLGKNSYSIYLWHMMAYELSTHISRPLSSGGFYLQVAIYLPGSLVMGLLAAQFVEFPILRFRERYFPPIRSA